MNSITSGRAVTKRKVLMKRGGGWLKDKRTVNVRERNMTRMKAGRKREGDTTRKEANESRCKYLITSTWGRDEETEIYGKKKKIKTYIDE